MQTLINKSKIIDNFTKFYASVDILIVRDNTGDTGTILGFIVVKHILNL